MGSNHLQAKAIEALRNSSGPTYSPAMVWDRQRVEAVALALLGKTDAAFAALAEVPEVPRSVRKSCGGGVTGMHWPP